MDGEPSIRVFWADAAALAGDLDALRATVPPHELRPLESYRDPAHAATIAGTRMLARLVLSAEVGVPPAAVVISRRCGFCGHPDHGKPSVAGAPVSFNASHAAGMGVVAIGRGVNVGVDVEESGRRLDDSVAAQVLSAAESLTYVSLSTPDRHDFLLDRWTATEAVLKAIGLGLAVAPSRVTFRPAQDGWRVAQVEGPEPDAASWRVAPPIRVAGHLIAVAADRCCRVVGRPWRS